MEKVRHRPEHNMRACGAPLFFGVVWYSVQQIGQLSAVVSISIVIVLAMASVARAPPSHQLCPS